MRWLIAAVIAVHGLIHLMGFAKAFGYAALPQLTQPISRPMGAWWLVAAVAVVAAAVMIAMGSRYTWLIAAVALVLSQAVILSAWRDAWAGSVANVILLLVAALGWFTEGPRSFHAQFDRDAAPRLTRSATTTIVGDEDLEGLPAAVQRYLRLTGIVGQPRVSNYRLRFRGRIRSGPDTVWMPFEADQQSFTGNPIRLFHMRARMYGLPVDVFHRMTDGHATMRVKLFGAFPMANASGVEMDRAESVTLLNDMCLLAPGTLLDPAITWQTLDDGSVRAQLANGAQTIAATLHFGEDGLLRNFVSDDRSRSPDGKTFTPVRFSTPVRGYRSFGPLTLAADVEARWHLPAGEFVYGEFILVDAVMNAPPRRP